MYSAYAYCRLKFNELSEQFQYLPTLSEMRLLRMVYWTVGSLVAFFLAWILQPLEWYNVHDTVSYLYLSLSPLLVIRISRTHLNCHSYFHLKL